MFDTFILLVLQTAFTIHQWWFLGLFAGAFLLSIDIKDKESYAKIALAIVGLVASFPVVALFTVIGLSSVASIKIYPSTGSIFMYVAAVIASIAGVMLWLRFGVRKFDVIAEKLTAKSELERNKKTDAREMEKYIPQSAFAFDPLKFIDKNKGTFLGLDEKEKPVYIPRVEGKGVPHIQVVGTTGAGKGVVLGVMASQFLDDGEAVFFFDPKNDEWAPSVLYASAKRMGKPYHYINLNRPNGAQFNLFEGATEDEAFELFQAGFSLVDKGSDADFYGIVDRAWALKIAKKVAENDLTLAQVYSMNSSALHDKDTGAAKFAGRLQEMANMPSINAESGAGGVSLEKIIEEGGCVYVVGSTRNDIVKTVQRILLVRLIQLAERRDRMAEESVRKVCIVLDEVKYHLSKPAQEALGTARDKGVHLVLAHQSLGDLRDCGQDMNPDAVVDAIVENCSIKISYKVMNPETAEWMAASSLKIQVDDETRTVTRNIAGAEVVANERAIRQSERFLIDENMLMSLKPSTAAVFGLGLAQFISVRPLKVKKDREAIRINTVGSGVVQTDSDKIADLADLSDLSLPALPEGFYYDKNGRKQTIKKNK